VKTFGINHPEPQLTDRQWSSLIVNIEHVRSGTRHLAFNLV
jgi:hypothetical protein